MSGAPRPGQLAVLHAARALHAVQRSAASSPEYIVPNLAVPSPPPALQFYGDLQGASYYSVAVVNKEFCTDGVTLANLKVRLIVDRQYQPRPPVVCSHQEYMFACQMAVRCSGWGGHSAADSHS